MENEEQIEEDTGREMQISWGPCGGVAGTIVIGPDELAKLGVDTDDLGEFPDIVHVPVKVEDGSLVVK